MKKLLITLLIGLMTAGLVFAGEVKESVVIDNALTHKQDYEVAKEPKRQRYYRLRWSLICFSPNPGRSN